MDLKDTYFWVICIKIVCFFMFQKEKEMEKQMTLYQQARLHQRAAAEMVIQMISASKGRV